MKNVIICVAMKVIHETKDREKIRHGQNIIQNDTKCILYPPRRSDRAIRSMQFMHTDLLGDIGTHKIGAPTKKKACWSDDLQTGAIFLNSILGYEYNLNTNMHVFLSNIELR